MSLATTARYEPRRFLRRIEGPVFGLLCFLVFELWHHIVSDHESLELMRVEIDALLAGREQELVAPRPFRNLVAQARRGGLGDVEHERYFRTLLGDIDEPTVFGPADGVVVVHSLTGPDARQQLVELARTIVGEEQRD